MVFCGIVIFFVGAYVIYSCQNLVNDVKAMSEKNVKKFEAMVDYQCGKMDKIIEKLDNITFDCGVELDGIHNDLINVSGALENIVDMISKED